MDTFYMKENEKLYKVLEANALISSSLNLFFVLDTLMEKAKEVMDAEASSLMLLDDDTQELYFHTVKGEKSDAIKEIRLKVGEGISGWVAQNKKPVLVEDCSKDPRFSNKVDKKSQFVTNTMMSVPLVVNDRLLGTVQVLNKKNGAFFNENDLKIFQVLAIQAAIAIENARLHEMATIDGMTRLYVKSYFLARFQEEFRFARHNDRNLAMIMSDIDHFKRVNDTFGHQGGDAALKVLASVILETVEMENSGYLAGRYGGEEFCILLPGADDVKAMEISEKIRRNIESRPIPIGDDEAKITISLGISSYPRHKEHLNHIDDFIRLADEALYLCKRGGRNLSKFYSSEEVIQESVQQ